MASRYWVGGSGDWSDAAHWSQTSGGSGGWPPLSDSDINFDSASSGASYTVTGMPSSLTCASLYINNPSSGTVTFSTYSTNLYVSGGYVVGSGVTVPSGRNVKFQGTDNGSLRTNGIALGTVLVDKTGGSITQSDDLTASSFTLVDGIWQTANYALTTTGDLKASVPTLITAGLYFGTSTVTVGGVLDFYSEVAGALTFSGASATVYVNKNNATAYSMLTGGQAFGTIWKSGSSGKFGGTGFQANTLYLSNSIVVADSGMTITAGAVTVVNSGGSSNPFSGRSALRASSGAANVTLTVSTSCILRGCMLEGITYSGPAPSVSGGSIGDLGGNIGLSGVFDTPQNVFWVPTSSGLYASQAYWSNTSGGAISSTLYPLPQHTMVMDNNSLYTLTVNLSYAGSFNASARTTSTNVTFSSAAVYGNIALSSSVRILTSSGYTFANRYTTQTLDSNGSYAGGVISGTAGTVTVDKYDTDLVFLDSANFVTSPLSIITGAVRTAYSLEAGSISISTGASLEATSTIKIAGSTTAAWSAAPGATYIHNDTGYIWVPKTGSSILSLGDVSYNKIYLNQAGTFTLNVSYNPYIAELISGGDFPYAQPAGVVFSGAGTATIYKWGLNGTSTSARIAVSGTGGAQIATTSYYPIQASNISLTSLPAAQVDKCYATGSLDNGGNTNWVFGVAPVRTSALLVFFQ